MSRFQGPCEKCGKVGDKRYARRLCVACYQRHFYLHSDAPSATAKQVRNKERASIYHRRWRKKFKRQHGYGCTAQFRPGVAVRSEFLGLSGECTSPARQVLGQPKGQSWVVDVRWETGGETIGVPTTELEVIGKKKRGAA